MIGHYDASDAFPTLNDGDPVTLFPEKIAGRDLSQADVNRQPAFRQISGINTVRFDRVAPPPASTDDLLLADIAAFEVDDFSLFVVVAREGIAQQGFFSAQFSETSPNISGFTLSTSADGNTNLAMAASGTVFQQLNNFDGSLGDGTFHQITAIKSGTTGTVFVDGTQRGQKTDFPVTINYSGTEKRTTMGPAPKSGGFTRSLLGSISEVLLYSGGKNSTEQGIIENYLKSKWGTPLV